MQSNLPEPDKDQTPPPEEMNLQLKLGKSMIIIGWVMGILLLTWLFGIWEEKIINPNDSPISAKSQNAIEVILLRNRYGHYMVSGQVNYKPALFMLDTGATYVAVPGELENELGLSRGQQGYSHTANGTAISYSTIIEQLKVGDIVLKNVKASITPGMEGKEILLGMSVLKQLEFTQKGDQLTLRQLK